MEIGSFLYPSLKHFSFNPLHALSFPSFLFHCLLMLEQNSVLWLVLEVKGFILFYFYFYFLLFHLQFHHKISPQPTPSTAVDSSLTSAASLS